MPKRFTSVLWLVAGLALAGCATVSPPEGDDAAARTEQTLTTAPTGSPVGTEESVSLPTPPLQLGSQEQFERGVQLMREQQYQAAEALFTELTNSQPELAGPWVNLGHIHLAQSQTDAARQDFERALTANPHNCDAHNQLGVMARRAGRFSQAEQHYLECLQANPGYTPARLNLGILYELYMGRLGEALAAYHDYQAASPEPDARVDGWVMDLERRVAAIAKR
jgi:tetratricopeptide (TPR) repeat protein